MAFTMLEGVFWACAAFVFYAYIGYPLLMGLLARVRTRPVTKTPRFEGTISIVLVVFNEEHAIRRRLDELTGLIAGSPRDDEIIVVSDGSTDATARLAKSYSDKRVRVLEFSENTGKAAALTRGCAECRGDVIVFADVRQRWAADALEQLLRCFGDPEVGAVSGDLTIEAAPGLMSGVGLYWRYEKWLRRKESQYYSTIGVSGSISAVRRKLFSPIPQGTLLDDVYWPLQVIMQGYRVVHEGMALAYDQFPDRARDEFRRKVRTLSGNYQLLTLLPAALLPWRNPVWFEYLSHKVLRLFVPWAMLVLLLASALLSQIFYRFAFLLQCGFYALAIVGMMQRAGHQARITSAAGSFLVLNAAAWCAFWIWLTGRADASWRKARYSDHRETK